MDPKPPDLRLSDVPPEIAEAVAAAPGPFRSARYTRGLVVPPAGPPRELSALVVRAADGHVHAFVW